MNGAGDFLYKGAPKNAGTYMQRLSIIHNVSCVYIKYAMIDKKIFKQIDGFEENFKGIAINIDTCLKILSKDKQVVINPLVSICVNTLEQADKIIDEEEKLKNKWKKEYEKEDSYFSPNLSKTNTGLSIKI